jgi:hypothetical protein
MVALGGEGFPAVQEDALARIFPFLGIQNLVEGG